jgi:hypothetical protein
MRESAIRFPQSRPEMKILAKAACGRLYETTHSTRALEGSGLSELQRW